MKLVIQRVLNAEVKVSEKVVGAIDNGLLVLMGIEKEDGPDDVVWLVNKLINLRIFNDQSGVMNESLIATEGNLLVISQFTLMASTKKGNRPCPCR